MTNIILFDDDSRENLLPLTYTKPVCELRVGILTIREKWEKVLKGKVSFITQEYLSKKYPINITADNIVINGSVLPSERLLHLIKQLNFNEALMQDEELIAARLDESQFHHLMSNEEVDELDGFDVQDTPFIKINFPYDIFLNNKEAIESDFELLTKNRTSAPLHESNTLIGDRIFVEEGASVLASILNSESGPIYIGKEATVCEGSMIRGALALCNNGVIKMGAKIYGATTIGPFCKVGGEVNNSVMSGYSNKGHEGYLGNSVLGEWCNLGADTNNSNLKNNYAEVKLWHYPTEKFKLTGETFCGLIMGDHSKCGINTMFNTGTVIGVFANIFGAGYPRNFVPSFAWGGKAGFTSFKIEKAFEIAERVMQRRGIVLNDIDKEILGNVFVESAQFRNWEKPIGNQR